MEIAIGLLAIAATVLGGSCSPTASTCRPRSCSSSWASSGRTSRSCRGGPQPRGRAARHPAPAPVCRRDPDLARRLPQQPGGHPRAVGRARALHGPRGRALPPVGARDRLRARLRHRRRRRAAGRGRRDRGRPTDRLPRRLVTILEGESLLNDATALVSLRTALAAAGLAAGVSAGGVSFGGVVLDFAWASVGGAAIGFAVALLVTVLRRHFSTEPAFDTVLSFMVPFAAYVPAEELHASGVIAVVTAGLVLATSRRARSRVPPASASGSTGPPSSSSSRTRSSSSSACRCSTSSTARGPRPCRSGRSRSRPWAPSSPCSCCARSGSCPSGGSARTCCATRRRRRGPTPSCSRGPACAAW